LHNSTGSFLAISVNFTLYNFKYVWSSTTDKNNKSKLSQTNWLRLMWSQNRLQNCTKSLPNTNWFDCDQQAKCFCAQLAKFEPDFLLPSPFVMITFGLEDGSILVFNFK